ncbi:hypothetical protein D918_03725 [Trichuris suis]|nr:hypothetical protein D918_03725 [Trichuris suis]
MASSSAQSDKARQYLVEKNVPSLMIGLVSRRPDDVIQFMLDGLRTIRTLSVEELKWDMFIDNPPLSFDDHPKDAVFLLLSLLLLASSGYVIPLLRTLGRYELLKLNFTMHSDAFVAYKAIQAVCINFGGECFIWFHLSWTENCEFFLKIIMIQLS